MESGDELEPQSDAMDTSCDLSSTKYDIVDEDALAEATRLVNIDVHKRHSSDNRCVRAHERALRCFVSD